MDSEMREKCAEIFMKHISTVVIYFERRRYKRVADNIDLLMIGFTRALNDSENVDDLQMKIIPYIKEELQYL